MYSVAKEVHVIDDDMRFVNITIPQTVKKLYLYVYDEYRPLEWIGAVQSLLEPRILKDSRLEYIWIEWWPNAGSSSHNLGSSALQNIAHKAGVVLELIADPQGI